MLIKLLVLISSVVFPQHVILSSFLCTCFCVCLGLEVVYVQEEEVEVNLWLFACLSWCLLFVAFPPTQVIESGWGGWGVSSWRGTNYFCLYPSFLFASYNNFPCCLIGGVLSYTFFSFFFNLVLPLKVNANRLLYRNEK